MIWRSRNSYNLIYWSFGFSGMQKVVKDFDRHTPTHNVNKTHTNAIETLWMIFQFHIKRPLPALLFILICTYFWQLFHYFFTSLKYYVKFIYQVESYYPTPPWDKQKWFKIYRIKLQWFTIIHVSSNPGMQLKCEKMGLHWNIQTLWKVQSLFKKLLVCTEKSVIFMETKHELFQLFSPLGK